MSNGIPERFEQVTAVCKANVYFDGNVVSHTLLFNDGSRKTLGLIYPGVYTFNTGAPERMELVAGDCRVKRAGESDWTACEEGATFEIPGNSSFDIAVDAGVTQYICSFLA